MTATNHAMMGAVIALAVKRPELAIPVAFLSHFVMDAVPHFGVPPGEFVYTTYRKFVVADFGVMAISTAVIAIILTSKFWLILACMVAAVAPDLIWYFYRDELERNELMKMDRITRFHQRIQTKEFMRGIYIEAPLFVIFWSLVVRFKLRG